MGGDVARIAEKRNACRFFVARAEGTVNRWEGLRDGFRVILKFVLNKYAQPVTEINTKNIFWEVRRPMHRADNLTTLTLRRLMSYIYGAPILDVSRSHTMTQHSR